MKPYVGVCPWVENHMTYAMLGFAGGLVARTFQLPERPTCHFLAHIGFQGVLFVLCPCQRALGLCPFFLSVRSSPFFHGVLVTFLVLNVPVPLCVVRASFSLCLDILCVLKYGFDS